MPAFKNSSLPIDRSRLAKLTESTRKYLLSPATPGDHLHPDDVRVTWKDDTGKEVEFASTEVKAKLAQIAAAAVSSTDTDE